MTTRGHKREDGAIVGLPPSPRWRSGATLLLAGVMLGGCAGYQHYEPAVLVAPRSPAALMTRRLDDPGLASFLSSHGAARHDSAWDSRQLALAALYFRTDLDAGRARVAVARAGEITAAAHPSANVGTAVGRATSLEAGKSSPWTVSLNTGITFETGGKRAARIDRAQAATLAAVLRLQTDAWRVASETRHAVTLADASDQDVTALTAVVAMEREVLTHVRARFAEGALSAAEVARVEAEGRRADVDETAALEARAEARLAVGRNVGVPFAQVEHLSLRADPRSDCSTLLAARPDSLMSVALTQRYDLGAALADYAVAEADVRVAIGGQYPDVTIGPGFSWDQGITRWIFSAALQSIPAARNRGPVAEATARRALVAANAALAQQAVVVSVDSAIATCRNVVRGQAAADALVASTERQLDLVQAAFRRGETGATEVVLARLAQARARQSHVRALARSRAAGVSLEDALGAWVGMPMNQWPDVTTSAVSPTPSVK